MLLKLSPPGTARGKFPAEVRSCGGTTRSSSRAPSEITVLLHGETRTPSRGNGARMLHSSPAVGRTLHVMAKHVSPWDDDRHDDHHQDRREIARKGGREPPRKPL